ncbi:mitogen-activated protein kinase kinase kinase 20-like [Primulina huaijiensis]|uniref:mitogen-activated protein kinase kinase kinase 20-like n=1 Tax=Primulina huaijiensis TaxID=1492673 RepID=UPI003CC7392B
MDWVRGGNLGHGSFATVNLAMPRRQTSLFPPLMAVKSCGVVRSSSLMNEKLILEALKDCPQIIRCFGDSFSYENGEKLYNVLLEYAPSGSLADKLKNTGDGGLPESETRRYTKALLKGLHYIHKLGYVHCDIKLQNILLGPNDSVKIADFGLAKRAGGRKENFSGCELRGTPLYMSPEIVTAGEQGAPADIWALGCAVAEMVTGTLAWHCSDVAGLLLRIGAGEEFPEVPKSLSEQGKDFLGKCFVRDPKKRWTAEMLLNHHFVSDYQDFDFNEETENKALISPTCPFDFPEWESPVSGSSTTFASSEYPPESGSWSMTPARRLQTLWIDQFPDWSVTEDWITLR